MGTGRGACCFHLLWVCRYCLLLLLLQVTARSTGLPLDNMAVETNVTTMLSAEEATAYPEDGSECGAWEDDMTGRESNDATPPAVYVHGLFMEGARWASGEDVLEGAVVVGHTPCAGHITDSRLKQLLPIMPVLYLKAVPVQPTWIPTSGEEEAVGPGRLRPPSSRLTHCLPPPRPPLPAVGFLRQDPSIYDCPVYTTTFRGHTYTFLATLKSACGEEGEEGAASALLIPPFPPSWCSPGACAQVDPGGCRAHDAGGRLSGQLRRRASFHARSCMAWWHYY